MQDPEVDLVGAVGMGRVFLWLDVCGVVGLQAAKPGFLTLASYTQSFRTGQEAVSLDSKRLE